MGAVLEDGIGVVGGAAARKVTERERTKGQWSSRTAM
jgi:hypothetical protein